MIKPEGKKHIHAVDDDDNERTALKKLTVAGFEVEVAVNGEKGLMKALELHSPTLYYLTF